MAKASQKKGKGTSGARIRHAAHPLPWFRTTRFLYSAVVGGVLVIGIVVGTGLGLWLSPSGTGTSPQSTVPIRQSDIDDVTLPKGPPLPVIVQGSETAKRLYEESLANQPEALRPNPNEAPAQAAKPDLIAALPAPLALPDPEPATPENSKPETGISDAPAVVDPGPMADPNTWLANAVPLTPDPGMPMIALIFDDLGIDQAHSRQAINLPAPLTLAFLTYGHHLQEMVTAARQRGHEILVHFPMAPLDLSVDPGPNALQRELGPQEILRRLDFRLYRDQQSYGQPFHGGLRGYAPCPERIKATRFDFRRFGYDLGL